MNWPWVSRLAYELVVEERDRLRGQVDELLDHSARLSRRSLDMPEQPRGPNKRAERVVIPEEIEEIIAGFDSEAVRVGIREQIRVRRVADPDEPWHSIERELARQVGPVDEPQAASAGELG